MKLVSFISKKIFEEFAGAVRSSDGQYIEIFENPSEDEFRESQQEISDGKYIRFIADSKSKKVYIFPPRIIHQIVANKLGLKMQTSIWGVAKKRTDGWWAVSSDMMQLHPEIKKPLFEKNWSWAEKYIKLESFINFAKKARFTADEKVLPWEMQDKFRKAQKKKNFNEEFKGTLKNFLGKEKEYFLNPTPSEIKSCMNSDKTIRFMIVRDGSKINVYVFNDIFHKTLAKELDIKDYLNNQGIIAGEGKVINDKIHAIESSNLDFINSYNYKKVQAMLRLNWKNPYVDIIRLKREYE